MAKKPRPNYVPRISWECHENNYGFWVVNAYAEIPGDATLEVSGEYRIPFTYAKRVQGIGFYMKEIVREAEISLSYKYNMLVRKHAHKNKHAQAALDTITEWQDKHEQS